VSKIVPMGVKSSDNYKSHAKLGVPTLCMDLSNMAQFLVLFSNIWSFCSLPKLDFKSSIFHIVGNFYWNHIKHNINKYKGI
jgi:hypothetical protein